MSRKLSSARRIERSRRSHCAQVAAYVEEGGSSSGGADTCGVTRLCSSQAFSALPYSLFPWDPHAVFLFFLQWRRRRRALS